MLSKYNLNAIITGYIDSYCLVCESHLRSEDDVIGHIAKPIHSKNLDAAGFLEKYKDDCVRKVKKGYYCEFCNILLTTAAKVGLHIVEEKHVTNKGKLLLRRMGNNIAFHNSILIHEKAWNGLIDETCAICNTEFDNESLHKTDAAHILNLVQNKLAFGPNNSIYRRIDDGSFQCLTCNMVLGLNTLTTHFEDAQHTKLYQECSQAFIELNKNAKPDKDSETKQEIKMTTAQQVKDKPILVAPTNEVKKPAQVTAEVPKTAVVTEEKKVTPPAIEKIEVKKATPTATIKKPDIPKQSAPPVEVSKKIETSSEIKKSDKSSLEKVTKDLDDQICKALNAKDYITHDENGKKWCLLCDWTMETLFIKNHINGRHHLTMLKMHKERLQKKCQNAAEETPIVDTKGKVEKETSGDSQNKSKILDSVSQYQRNDININFECNTAVCKKCCKYLDFNCQAIEAHIEEHKKAAPKKETIKAMPTSIANQKQEDKKTQAANTQKEKKQKRIEEERSDSRASSVASNKENDEEVEKFAKAHDLAYNRSDSKVYCRTCDSRVPSSLKNMKEHIAGIHHKNKAAKWNELKQNSKVPVTVKKTMKDFIKNLVGVENGFVKDVIINERFCINIFSFMMITRMEKLRCEACDVNLSIGQLDEHKASVSHQRAMCETPIIVSMESEFIREVRPEVFHCGFCNIAFEESSVSDHLSTVSHREARTAAGWRLQQCLPELAQHHALRNPVEMLMLMRMLAADLFC